MNAQLTRVLANGLLSSGAWSAWQRIALRNRLTVVSFHRVLAPGDRRWGHAHPTWTVSTEAFERCLQFFERHYHPVSLKQVGDALSGAAELPNAPLLITFDDGWADNEEHALPLLRQYGMPSLLFVATEALVSGVLWQEPLLRAWEEGRITFAHCRALGGATVEHSANPLQALLVRLAMLDPAAREAAISELRPLCETAEHREMLTTKQLRALSNAGVAIGSHGLTHSPLAMVDDPLHELQASRRFLEAELGNPIASLSFPHGSFNGRVLQAARKAGYQLLFTSSKHLNLCRENHSGIPLLGRIPIVPGAYTDSRGRIDSGQLARWLALRPTGQLELSA